MSAESNNEMEDKKIEWLRECRNVQEFEKLQRIEEGSYGIVYKAKDLVSNKIVALKRLKLEKEKDGFPITALREIHTLKLAAHPNIVGVKEIASTNDYQHIFIVMEYMDHDLKSVLEARNTPFLLSESKTLIVQILNGISCLHQNWIIHRDLKSANLLLSNDGIIKIADFGLARRYSSPLGDMTQLVVTLWYRAPELLFGTVSYSTAVDMWSVGCIFGELIENAPILQGKGEIDQITKIFKLLGSPTEQSWPGFSRLPNANTINFVSQPTNQLPNRFPYLSTQGMDLFSSLLCYDPPSRLSAREALSHHFFKEKPLPKPPQLFPSFPSKKRHS